MDEVLMRRAIEQKQQGAELDSDAWHAIIAAYMLGSVDDAQMAALAMACVFQGLSNHEAAALTRAMVASGRTLRYDGETVLDKHSSGGVADIVSLVAVPLVAASGVRVAKLSGRALGHTGGTIDKLETIPGFNVALDLDEFVRQVETIGCAIAAQSDELVPADKRLYRLRDRTATVPSVGLIAASIVSKKVAAGAHAFVFDVKCGSAAFMKDRRQAVELAERLVAVAREFGKSARAIVSDMNEPLGRNIGSGIEMIEARDFLRGSVNDARMREQCIGVAAAMLECAGSTDGRRVALEALESGAGYEKLLEMVAAQGGSRSALEAMRLPIRREVVRAPRDGFVSAIDGVMLGTAARHWSAEEPTAGIRVAVRIGDRVTSGDLLAECFGDRADASAIAGAFTIADERPTLNPLVYATL